MKIIVLFICLFSISACSNIDRTDAMWYGIHAIDVAQTIQISNNPHCYMEVGPILSRTGGHHPSKDEVYYWAIGSVIFYHLSTKFIKSKVSPQTYNNLSQLNLYFSGKTIANNYALGLDGIGDPECRYA